MSCEICGRSSCTKSFHSVEEQDNFDNIAEDVKERTANRIKNAVNSLDYEIIDDVVYVKLDSVIDCCE